MQEIKNHGIVYKITNKINGKIYIGKTKEYYGNNRKKKFGIEGRLKHHIRDSLSGRKYNCIRLCNAIRKYGKDNFKIEEILKCELDDVDDHETEQIKKFDSTNPKIGYNIALGGKGRSVVHVSEEARLNISKAQNKSSEMNIKPYYKNDILIGYTVRRREKGIHYQKLFSKTKNTPEENYKLAITWLNNMKNNVIIDTKYNKENDLPQNISFVKNEEGTTIIGYQVSIKIGSKNYYKRFQAQTLTLIQKLELALEYKKSIMNKEIFDSNKYKKKREVPQYISILKNKDKTEIIGYRFAISINGKKTGKSFQDQTLSLEEKLQLAINYKESILSKNH